MKTKTGHSKQYLLKKLVEAAELLGHSPSQRNIESLKDFPSRGAYRNHFGSFASAMKEAGLPMIGKGSLSPNHPFFNDNPGNRYNHPGKRLKRPLKNFRTLRASIKSHLKVRFKILKRDGFKCVYCGRTPADGAKLIIDHFIPFAKGGLTTPDNLVTTCFECNAGKADILLDSHILKKTKAS